LTRWGRAYFALGVGAFLALYLPQPLLPELDREFRTRPEVTGFVMTASLLGFAVAGLLPGGRRPSRTLRLAVALVAACSVVAAFSPGFSALLAARAGQGLGVGLLVAGGLADVPRRVGPAMAGRMTGAVIGGTALGGLSGRGFGYVGHLLGWRASFLLGGAAVVAVLAMTLRALPPVRQEATGALPAGSPAPATVVAAGLGVLFVNVGMFDLLPYRLEGPPFGLSPLVSDIVFLAFVPAIFAGTAAGRLVDRRGSRAVIIGACAAGIALMASSLVPALATAALAGLGAVCGAVALNTAHSAIAAAHGRRAVGRYLAAYYVGGAASAPISAAAYRAWGWSATVLMLSGAWAGVALLAAARHQPDRAQREAAIANVPPAGGLG
jgi:YNFM family putative membrane transporter